jgi:hypothetical protein
MSRPALSPAQTRRLATPEFPLLYRTLRGPVRTALSRWFDLRVSGIEHLPATGPYIVAANHHNYLDAVVLAVSVPTPIATSRIPKPRASTRAPVSGRPIQPRAATPGATVVRFAQAAGRGDAAAAERWAADAIARAAGVDSSWDRLEALRARGVAALLAREPERAAEILTAGAEPLRELIGAMHSKLLLAELRRSRGA